MNEGRSSYQWISLAAAGLLALALAGCGGGGSGGAGNVAAAPPPADAAAAARALQINVTGVTVNSAPVVTFTVTDQDGAPVSSLAAADLRFNIAKLMPGSDGEATAWQNYINRVRDGAVQGSQERSAAGFAFGTLSNNGKGSYTYTFATDITSPAANPCPAPCTDANGKPLDIGYQPGLTHRVTIQQGNRAYPLASGIYDFAPSGGGVAARRDIVATAKCNECHNELTVHGTRVDTRLCVTCHNPGSWVAGTPNTTVDFKVMIHKIHQGASLPSVVASTPYVVAGTDFSNAAFPQDVRNCTKCHDGTPGAPNATLQGDNWKLQPNAEACGSCHDDVYFGITPDPARPYQTLAHPGGALAGSGTCALCHAAGRYTDNKDIVVAHNFPARLKAAAARFKYNILSVTPTTAGSAPVITFSVTDPTNTDRPYDVKADSAFTAGGASTLTVKLAWSTTDVGNDGSGSNFGQPVSINLLNNPAVVAGGAAGTYTATSPVAVPPTQTGTLRVIMDGHPAADVTSVGSFTDRLAVKSVFKDVAITGPTVDYPFPGPTVVPRRTVVDIAKCDACHDVLSLHGSNRTDEPGVCVICHNPNATDAGRRPSAAGALTGGADGKLEESIDFKRMIHAIHAGESGKGGFRTKGIVVYGFGGSVNDFSDVVFPGRLNDCTTCHAGTSYQLGGAWASPVASGILGSTISTGASASDSTDNLRISPTASVCSSCHDSAATQIHMEDTFQGATFSATQTAISAADSEHCAFCHGPDAAWDVKRVHGVK